MKKPTEDLAQEHVGIIQMLKIMEKVSGKLKLAEAVPKEHLEKMVEFIRNFADKCHHGKEEDILFPELAKAAANQKLVNELLGEHKTGRDFIRGIADSLAGYAPGNADATHIALNLEGYVALLKEHIKKENSALFTITDKTLSNETQEKISKRFEVLEEEIIGHGKHQEYHGWLRELKSLYS